MTSYQFRISKRDGTLHLQMTETCPDDDRALQIGRTILSSRGVEKLRMEIWRDDVCIYDVVAGRGFLPIVINGRSSRPASRERRPGPDEAA